MNAFSDTIKNKHTQKTLIATFRCINAKLGKMNTKIGGGTYLGVLLKVKSVPKLNMGRSDPRESRDKKMKEHTMSSVKTHKNSSKIKKSIRLKKKKKKAHKQITEELIIIFNIKII